MQIHVASGKLVADVTTVTDVSGREHLVVIVKASWRIPAPGQRPRPIKPEPLVFADEFYGEPGLSAMRYGSDYVRFKPRCDVLFEASAHAPEGCPVTDLRVGVQVGTMKKALQVIGPRQWQQRLGRLNLGAPEPFTCLPLHFGLAFGGTRSYTKGRGQKQQTLSESLLANPAGLGWVGPHTRRGFDVLDAPCLMALNARINTPGGRHVPVALSPVARHWSPRSQYAGTYDEQWAQNVSPFLPEDFDEQYHQSAPEDQQIPYPKGGEPVILRHLMAGRPDVRFALPRLDTMQVRILRTDYSTEQPPVMVDTLFFEPDKARFSAVWRTSVPIRRRLQEFSTLAIGPVDLAWWRAHSLGLDGSGCAGCGGEPGQEAA